VGPACRGDGPIGPLRRPVTLSMLHPMSHPELLPAFCMALAVELAHLRWILLTQWKCKCHGKGHIHCTSKPVWIKFLL
jgi:hypothetical protein